MASPVGNLDTLGLSATEQRVDKIQQAFLDVFRRIDERISTYDYKPMMTDPRGVCLYFDWEEEVASTAGGSRGPVNVNWQWIVDVYVYGYDRREMQRDLRGIVLKMREDLRENRLLGRDEEGRHYVKQLEVRSIAPATDFTYNEGDNTGMVKKLRLIAEVQV